MIKVTLKGNTYRTHSLDRIARRFYGRNAVVIINEEHGDLAEGVFAVRDVKRDHHFLLRDPFMAEPSA